MRSFFLSLFLAASAFAGVPEFKMQEIDTGLKIGYAVVVSDVDGDKKPDIVVVDQHKVVWYQNPTWKKRVILNGKTAPDNVCITAMDIDGDGLPEFVIGAAWKPFDTTKAATLQWVKRGKSLDDEWTMHAIPNDEPMIHRIRAIDLDGDGKPELVSVPLMGRDSTKEKNWMDGRPLRITSYKMPAKDPEKPESWKPVVISDSLHVAHNFDLYTGGGFARKGNALIVGSYEGVSMVYPEGPADKWKTVLMHEANQANSKGSLGASEIKSATDKHGAVATIEPWHGNQVVVYTLSPQATLGSKWKRTVIDDQLRWGHGVNFADLDGDGTDELVIGVRDNPTKDDKFTEKRGVRMYSRNGEKWDRFILEDGGVAVEDLTTADLDGDGKPEIIAVGRATGNCRIYWNKGKK